MPFDFSEVVAPFRMQPGLRRIAPGAARLTPAQPGSRHLREKIEVLSNDAARALVATPGFAVAPVLATVAAEAVSGPTPAFVRASASSFAAPLLGWAVRDGDVQGEGAARIGDALRALAPEQRASALLCLAFEEDFAVIDGADATVPWLAVCLPSRWSPEEKVGRSFAAVHAPVADNELLVGAAEHLVRLVTSGERWERFVWTLSSDHRLDQHPARSRSVWPDGDDAEAIGALASFRQEHQTFIPIAGSPQAVFTIHVESAPLGAALTMREDAQRLHAALASMTPAVLAYRGLDKVQPRLLAWLARRVATLPAAAP